MNSRTTKEHDSEIAPTKEKSRLGRGLSALIPPVSQPSSNHPKSHAAEGGTDVSVEQIHDIPLASIVPNAKQPRTEFDDASLDDLAASITAHGVLQPILLRKAAGSMYEIIAGERRYRAAERAGLSRVPAIIREITDEESLIIALIENIQREDLNPIETANGYRQLLDEFHITQTELARTLGKGLSTLSNALRLLELPELIQESIKSGQLSQEHGKILLSITGRDNQLAIWRKIVESNLSVKSTYALIDSGYKNARSKRHRAVPIKDVHWKSLEDRFRGTMSLKVALKPCKDGKSELTIQFSNSDEMEDFLDRLSGTITL